MTTRKGPTGADSAIVDVWKRQVGELSTRNFANRRAASENLVLHFDVLRKLDRHQGCVNTLSFNATGDVLVSGADDRSVILWNWEAGKVRLSFHSGHHNNVFQAKFMPFTEDRSIVTCAADGQVRLAQILERGKVETNLLAKHHGRAHRLTIEPGSSHVFYTCGEDGLVQRIDLRTGTVTGHFTCKSDLKHGYSLSVGLYAITMAINPNFFAVGGSDQFVRLYDNRKTRWDASSDFDSPVDFFCPPHLIDDEHMGITGLAFSDQNELLASYSNEFIYLFTKDMGLGPDPDLTFNGLNVKCSSPANADDDNVKPAPLAYKGHRNCDTVKGVNFFGPKGEYVVSGSDCGRIFIWKKKDGELIRVMEADRRIVNCIESHPHDTVLASSGIEQDVKIWVPKSIERASLPTNIEKVTSWHSNGYFLWGGFYPDDEDDDDDDDDTSDEDGDAYEDCDDESDKMTDIDETCSEDEGLSEEDDYESDKITDIERSENEGLSEERLEEDDVRGDSHGGNENTYDDEVVDGVAFEDHDVDNEEDNIHGDSSDSGGGNENTYDLDGPAFEDHNVDNEEDDTHGDSSDSAGGSEKTYDIDGVAFEDHDVDNEEDDIHGDSSDSDGGNENSYGINGVAFADNDVDNGAGALDYYSFADISDDDCLAFENEFDCYDSDGWF